MEMIIFISQHKSILVDMMIIGVLSFLGQIFIYRLVKEFKQHIVPFIITTRKIFTVALSIGYYGHKYSYEQLIGVAIVFGASAYEFIS